MVVQEKKQLNAAKYNNAILYLLKYCNNRYLGATKLNKLLYYLDFISYRDRKKSVTGDWYIHKDYGPVPDAIDDVLANLKLSEKITVTQIPYKDGEKFEYKPLVEPDLRVFDDTEKALLENICKEFHMWSTDQIVNQTHLEAPWFYSKPYDRVDYAYASDIDILGKNQTE
jgi:uncharacterized phage-associated protein